jgi:hypothetical protein
MPFFEIVDTAQAAAVEAEQITVRQIGADGSVAWVKTTVTQLLGHNSRGEQEGWGPLLERALGWGLTALQLACLCALALVALLLLRWYVLRVFAAFEEQYSSREVHLVAQRDRARELRRMHKRQY